MQLPRRLVGVLGLAACLGVVFAAAPTPAPLWPGVAPGETKTLPPEGDTTKPSDRLIRGAAIVRLGNVSTPTYAVFRPDPAKNTGACVVVNPGGGYNILAIDLEGTEVCEWLNSIGVTAVLLKYRVPGRPGQVRYAAALQDAQRVMGLVRQQAGELGIDPKRVGMLGFSAGANLAAVLAGHFQARTYPPVDAADAFSCRPDFMVLIYPGGFVDAAKGDALKPEIVVKKEETPPAFLAMAGDDPVRVENAIYYYLALKSAGVPAEMHLYPTGGHGYGLRPTADNVTTWPARVADWLKASGWLKPAR